MDQSRERVQELKRLANKTRRLILETAYQTAAPNVVSSLSAVDMLVALYFDVLRLDPSDPKWEARDRFILSKGHAALGLYAVLALRGFFPVEELGGMGKTGSRLAGHPDMTRVPGVDMSTGSPGQGLSPGLGMALGAKIRGLEFLTYVMIGDGGSQEGQIWEASMIASKYQLDNLVVLLDCNRLQRYGWAGTRGYPSKDRQPPMEKPRAKWEAFGWYVLEINGHRFPDILSAIATTRQVRGRPTMIIAHTVKGKGVPFLEDDYRWGSKSLSDEDFHQALAELNREGATL